MTSPAVGFSRLPAVAAAPRRLGALLTAAAEGDTGLGDDGQPRWIKGVSVWPESAPGYRVVTDFIDDPDDQIDHGAKTGGAAPVVAQPFVVQTFTQCPRSDIAELRDRAERQLVANTSAAIAREMWTGQSTIAGPWTLPDGVPFELANPRADGTGSSTDHAGPWCNPYLAAADMLSDPAPHPAAAVGAVEAAAMARMAGGPVFIHVPPMLLLELSQFGIHPDGDVLTTPLGNVVVADAGYGAAVLEDSAALAVYATGPVSVWIGEQVVHDDPSEIVDTNTNQVGVWAERPALYLFDPQTAVGCTIEET